MTTLDYVLSLAGLAVMLNVMREGELSGRRLCRSLVIAAILAINFLHEVPTAGADGVLVALGVLAGAACAVVGALATRLDLRPDGTVIARAGVVAYAVTIVAFGGRMGFAFAATHGLGPSIGRFSASVGITSQSAWVASLVLMMVTDIAVRAILLWARRTHLLATDSAGARIRA